MAKPSHTLWSGTGLTCLKAECAFQLATLGCCSMLLGLLDLRPTSRA